MQKTENKTIGSYELELFYEETKRAYESLSPYEGEDVMTRFFCHILPRANEKSLAFLESFGIDPKKLFCARPVAEPDENGNVLFLCAARFCGRVLKGGDTVPRQSEEEEGISMVFVKDEKDFTPSLSDLPAPQTEMRFVMELPFDGGFFEGLQ